MEQMISREENYFEQVDGCWRGQARRSLTPLECEYIRAFFAADIPLSAIILGIQRTFANFKPKNSADHIRGIQYCVPEILNAAYEISPEEHWAEVLSGNRFGDEMQAVAAENYKLR